MQFMVKLDVSTFRKDLEELLKGLNDLFQHSKGMFFSTKDAGSIALAMCHPSMDALVDEYVRRGSESAEPAFSEYYYAKALAYAWIGKGKGREGETCWRKAMERRSGGIFYEWAQPFYNK
jgi:hypothetical protein